MLARPDHILRIEAAFVLAASLLAYFIALHGHWGFFALLILAPDLSLLGYAAKNHLRSAAMLYNCAHNYALPALLALVAWEGHSPLSAQIASIWIAHIGLDRLLGFGLKYPEAFKPTHIQSAGLYREM
jgi:hypothetical protein